MEPGSSEFAKPPPLPGGLRLMHTGTRGNPSSAAPTLPWRCALPQVDDVAITHLSFGTEFTKAVESKQVAQQEAERARFVVMKADQVRRKGPRGQ